MTTQPTAVFPLGVRLIDGGATFAVWAPHADAVSVAGSFNDFDDQRHPLAAIDGGRWQTVVEGAKPGDEYEFVIRNGKQRLVRINPYAREMTNSAGRCVIHDPAFDWQGDSFQLANWNELVIYEMHVGTFNRAGEDPVGTFEMAAEKLEYLQWLGVNAVELMPSAEFAGDLSWGYNPANPFSVESAYGGSQGLKEFVRRAHLHGIGVILDVVYNHLGPSDLGLWQYDGWSENGKGGIYFYNDHRSATPWGDTRPDYGRGEVRQYLFDNAMMWLDEYHMDGLRYDMTLYMRSIDGNEWHTIPEGWSLAQWINREVRARHPRKIVIAEDLRNNDRLTKPERWGGANFSSQWDANFVHPMRAAVITPHDAERSMFAVRDAVLHRYNIDAFERVIYTESHDEVANGKARVPSEINPGDPDSWFAWKRSTLGGAMALTSPGIPMLFQGQEFMRRGWFDDQNPIDWRRAGERSEVVQLYRDLLRLRLNRDGVTAGLTGQRAEVFHLNDADKVIAFRRWKEGGRGDETVVVANFGVHRRDAYRVGCAADGVWKVRLNSDAPRYQPDEPSQLPGTELPAEYHAEHGYDGLPNSLMLTLPPYSVVILSQDR